MGWADIRALNGPRIGPGPVLAFVGI